MDTNELIRKLAEFLEKEHYAELLEKIRKGEKHLVVDFQKIIEFEPELGDLILDQPEETIKAFELAVEQLSEKGKGFVIRIKNLTDSAQLMVRNIRSVHLGKLFFIEGVVRQKSDVRPQVTNAKFECPSCGNTIAVLQLDTKFKEPNKCSCGRQGRFRLLSKELIDAQGLVLEEVPEQLEGGEQPKRMSVFLKNDLVSPLSDKKTNPGSRILVVGTLKEVPIITKTGGQSTRYDLMFEANYFEPIEEDFSEVTISEEDRKKIKELAADPNLTRRLVSSIAPTIYGHEKIKESLMLQLLGGVRKTRDDASVTRGDIHILLVGDPGCIAGESQVALFTKGMEKIKNLGDKHLQPIREIVTKIRKNGKDKGYDFATLFQHYPQQAVLKVVTETGKEIICTYNQPLLTKRGWKRADEIKLKTEIRVMPKIPNNVKKSVQTNFVKVEKTTGKLKEINLPDKYTSELAALCGYVIGDGSVNKKGYSITCYVNESEKDLIEKLVNLWKKIFNVNARTAINKSNGKKIIIENGISREIISKQRMHIIEVNSRQINNSLSFLSNKRVPQEIFKSPKRIVAEFVSWLFEADGCSFGKGRGRTSIQLKSRTPELLKDVQILLLYFGIQSRIIEDNLCIRRSRDIEIFAENIGFKSKKKKKKLEETLNEVKRKSQTQKRKTLQRYEKVVKITPAGVIDVYDFEVPLSHMFVANGIVCHNSGKSMLLKRIGKVSPKGRFVSGKGASGAGLTATVVKDEFLQGWSLEAGALVLANRGVCAIDELDKMSPDDTAAMHEALEGQTITISKANIQATLRCETTVLAAANPKFGRFDPYGTIASQINLPVTLINRFDLIFPIKDLPNQTNDEKMAKFILELHKEGGGKEQDISNDLLRKYFAYARTNIKPKLTSQAIEEIKEYYLKMRASATTGEGIRSIPISARQLEALVRLSEAYAKIHLSDKVTKKDARKAVEMLDYCLRQVAFDEETGTIDIDRIATEMPATQRNKILAIKEVINDLESKLGKIIPLEDVIRSAAEKGIDEAEVEEMIQKLKRAGDIYEPKHGFVSKI